MDALGHIHSVLSIADELRRRGHKSIILTIRPLNMATELKAKGHGLECCEEQSRVTSSQSDLILKSIMQPMMDLFRQGLPKTFEATYTLGGICEKHFDDIVSKHDLIEAKLRSLKPDVVVVDHIVGIPCATQVARRWVRQYSSFPSVLYSCSNENYVAGLGLQLDKMTPEMKRFEKSTKASLREKIRRYFAEKGCQDWPSCIDFMPTSPYLNFYLGIEELDLDKIASLEPLPANWFRLEHTLDGSERSDSFAIPENLSKCPGKLIYFSLGTLVTSDVDLINRLLEILGKSPNKFIVSMGPMHNSIKLHPNMWGEKFLNQRAILPKVSLFITHGGHNSIIEAFYSGVPSLIVLPVFADQFDAAQRIEDCGFGVRLNPFSCTQQELLSAIDSSLANKERGARMKLISERLRSIKYHELAADKIEELLL